MLLKSKFENINKSFYNLDLNNGPDGELMNKQKVLIKLKNFFIESIIHHNQDCCIIHTNRYSKEELVEVVNIEGPYVLIAYLISGELTISRNNFKSSLDSDKLRIIHAERTSNIVVVPKECKTESILLYLKYSFFLNLMKYEAWNTKNKIYNLINSRKPGIPFNVAEIDINAHLQKIILEIISLKNNKKLNKYHLGIKLRELIFMSYHNEPENRNELDLNNELKKKLKEAKFFIDNNYRSTPTIKEISRVVLLNEMQLKRDFKRMYGNTIRGYIIERKMIEAKELLEKFSINEISSMLGYQSLSHFSSTFKKHYGLNPSKIKKKA